MSDNSPRSIVLAGGGTAGHVNPLLAVADALKERWPDVHCTAVGCPGGLEEDLVPARGYELDLVDKAPFPRRPDLAAARFPARWRRAVAQAQQILTTRQADLVIGFGGYASSPVYRAAAKLGIPIIVQEQNARPGLANRWGARRARAVATTFASTPLPSAVVTGLPMRAEVASTLTALREDRAGVRTAAAQRLGLDPQAPTLVLTGGSLGAQHLNEALENSVEHLIARGLQVLHLTGRGKSSRAEKIRSELAADVQARYVIHEYLEGMADAYGVADLIVCRSGAGTVFEISAAGVPAIYVPLPIGNGEQRWNATPAVDAGAARIIDDSQFTAQRLQDEVAELFSDPDALEAMRKASVGLADVDGAQRVVDLVSSVWGEQR